MDAARTFVRTRFSTDVIAEAVEALVAILPTESKPHRFTELEVDDGTMSWKYDSYDEFLAEHREPHDSFSLTVWAKDNEFYFHVSQAKYLDTSVAVKAPNRESILKVMSVFVKHAEASHIPEPVKKV